VTLGVEEAGVGGVLIVAGLGSDPVQPTSSGAPTSAATTSTGTAGRMLPASMAGSISGIGRPAEA
jgi:hypothetical protein